MNTHANGHNRASERNRRTIEPREAEPKPLCGRGTPPVRTHAHMRTHIRTHAPRMVTACSLQSIAQVAISTLQSTSFSAALRAASAEAASAGACTARAYEKKESRKKSAPIISARPTMLATASTVAGCCVCEGRRKEWKICACALRTANTSVARTSASENRTVPCTGCSANSSPPISASDSARSRKKHSRAKRQHTIAFRTTLTK